MFPRLATPVLTVDTEKIHKVDTANAQSLHGMWMGKLIAVFCVTNQSGLTIVFL